MNDLAEFLLARIVEDKVAAHRWHDIECEVPVASLADLTMAAQVPGAVCDCNGPARVLAECEAKRRIVELHDHGEAPCWEMHRGFVAPDWPEGTGRIPGEPWAHPSLEAVPERNDPCDTLRLLALPYADRSDYRDEWRP